MNEWISVKDRLPEHKTKVDVWEDFWGRIADCEYEHGWHNGIVDMGRLEVTHWMPLPPPPEDKVK